MNSPRVSLIIPALNEGSNLAPLCERIAAALSGESYEILIVDDNSRDNTREVCADLARSHPLRLIVREHPTNGLGGAVLHGMNEARGEVFVVMDADLQHPPEKLRELIGVLDRDAGDFALGSRYVPGGSTGEKWGVFRKFNSWIATLLARPFAGRTRDPMSGFFALKRRTFEGAERLTPLGYKIGLELMCKCRVQKVVEVPIHFAERMAGESKLSLREQFRYLEHLSRLYDFTFPRLSPVTKFAVVTLLGWSVGLGIFAMTLREAMPAVWSAPIAYLGHILVTAVFHKRYIDAQQEFLLTRHPWREFVLVSFAELLMCVLASMWTVTRLSPAGAWEVFLISFGAATVARYVMRKELMHDIRGLRRELRKEELQ